MPLTYESFAESHSFHSAKFYADWSQPFTPFIEERRELLQAMCPDAPVHVVGLNGEPCGWQMCAYSGAAVIGFFKCYFYKGWDTFPVYIALVAADLGALIRHADEWFWDMQAREMPDIGLKPWGQVRAIKNPFIDGLHELHDQQESN